MFRKLLCARRGHPINPWPETPANVRRLTYSCACGHAWVTKLAWERACEDVLAGAFDPAS